MNYYPTNPVPQLGTKETITHKKNTVVFEANYSKTRKLITSPRRTFNLSYPLITTQEVNTLENFFENNLGSTFYFTHPVTNIVYTALMDPSSLNKESINFNLYSMSITLKEV